MKITVTRFTSDDDSTLSTIDVDGEFVCFGLEDEYREIKKVAETRIPAGLYHVASREFGGFFVRYGHKFDFHRGMLEITGIPGFKHILIHIGNTDADTAGCLLVGTGCYAQRGNMSLQNSTGAYKKLYKKVIDAAEAGVLEIEVLDRDG